MQTIEEMNNPAIDRCGWRPGPWDGEPDKRQWIDEATGLPCLIVRNHMGALCGYVGVSAGHPWFEKPYQAVDNHVRVHGGLTYSNHCQEGICHVVEDGEDDNVWWIGFDCAHAGDLWPGHGLGEIYRDMAYVTAECASLAQQAKAASL